MVLNLNDRMVTEQRDGEKGWKEGEKKGRERKMLHLA